jgi:predicted CXXCH cytochrome family protein
MRIWAALVTMAAFAASLAAQSAPAGDSCLACHLLLGEGLGKPAQLFKDDIHGHSGYSCVTCHGGDPMSDDPEVSMSEARGFRGKINRTQIPALCGGCHGDATVIHKFKPQQRVDQLAQYRTSVHGQRLAAGDARVATCTDCHSVHDIREVKHALSPVHPLHLPETCARCHADGEHMAGYEIPTSQFEQYQRSVHWEAVAKRGDLSAPTCATCHGSHGATPPGVSSVANICGSCHVVFQNLFNDSPHYEVFSAMGVAACVQCHGNHEVHPPAPEMLGVSKGAVCVDCHSEGEPAYTVAAAMKQRLDELRAALDESEKMLNRAEQSGMEVSEGQLQLNSAKEQWIKARVQVHAFRVEPVEEAVTAGMTLAHDSYQSGEKALEEKNFRRTGLAVSLLTIVITMAGLWLAVRTIESKQAGTGQE